MAEPIFSFGLLADIQYADDETHVGLDRHFRASLAKAEAAIADFNDHDLAFVIHLGDLVDHDLENARPVLEILSRSRAPIYHVLGNHDFVSVNSPTRRSDPTTVIKTYGMEAYYTIDQPGWRFLALDTNDVGVIKHPPGSPEAGEAETRDTRLARRIPGREGVVQRPPAHWRLRHLPRHSLSDAARRRPRTDQCVRHRPGLRGSDRDHRSGPAAVVRPDDQLTEETRT